MQLGHAASDYPRACALLGLEPTATGPRDRIAQIPMWLTSELVATEPARKKLRDWCVKTTRDRWDEPGDPATVFVSIHAAGDEMLPHALAHVLCRIPAPVRHYAIEHVTFLLIGVQMIGWCGAVPDFGARRFVIALSAHGDDVEAFDTLAGHELSHCWLEPEPAPGARCASSFRSATLRSTPLANIPEDVRDRVLAERRRSVVSEHVACALARSWGFQDVV